MKPGVTIDFNKPVIEIEDLWKSFGTNHVLKGFNLTLHQGENIAVMGKSGSGKSVLIKCIIGLLTIDKGKLTVLGRSVPEINHKELDELRTDVGFQFQGSALYDSMTVRENLEFPLRRHREKLKGIPVNDLVVESLENVGLAHAVDMMPEELSGGMKKRVALARTLIMRPKIILYDEPTSGLDPVTGKEISLLINEIQERFQTAAIVITHDLGCAKITSDRMIILHDGINYTESTYSELNQSTDEPVKAFFT
ncbi:MAG TPA: ATP-binding cassette domain-containing protein [Cyclobacteriaceae bacterium]|nr:ATP-binding cassette domain-containing protein [Cyclobacteriaceae bacterium]HRJ82289.1 ATP-binding cassette domain-containing protein [Cyclobacteriaceae bacterium]